MKCKEVTAFLMDYVSGELPEDERANFEQHLSGCLDCREYLVQYESTIKAGQIACNDDDAVPAGVPEDLVKAILEARKH